MMVMSVWCDTFTGVCAVLDTGTPTHSHHLNIIQDNVLVPGLCCCHTTSHCTVVSINPTTPPQHTFTHCAWIIQWYSDRYYQLTAQSLKTTLLRLVSRISSDSKFISHCFSHQSISSCNWMFLPHSLVLWRLSLAHLRSFHRANSTVPSPFTWEQSTNQRLVLIWTDQLEISIFWRQTIRD